MPALIITMPASPPPKAITAAPNTMESSIGTMAWFIACSPREMWPAAIWPVSCAITPISSLGDLV